MNGEGALAPPLLLLLLLPPLLPQGLLIGAVIGAVCCERQRSPADCFHPSLCLRLCRRADCQR